jgi:serine/threonine protein phosphatase PrpC
MLARLKGMMHASKPAAPPPAPAPALTASDSPEEAPVAEPVASPPDGGSANGPQTPAVAVPALAEVPLAAPVAEAPAGEVVPVAEAVPVEAAPAELPIEDIPAPLAEAPPEPETQATTVAEAPPEAPPPLLCPVCGSPRRGESPSCDDCGYYFSKADLARAAAESAPPPPAVRLQGRYELGERIGERGGVCRYRGLDHGDGSRPAVPVVILEQERETQAALVAIPEPALALEAPEAEEDGDEVLPGFDALPAERETQAATEILPARPNWPSIAWERSLLSTLELPGLPAVLAWFTEGDQEYLVEEAPAGRPLWDAWDDPESTSEIRYGWLVEVAETLHRLHQCNAIVEGLRPDLVVIAPDGHARLADLGDLLPLPVPPDAPLRGTLYTAPELMGGGGKADARADLYSFGGMLYALHVGRDLSEVDFDKPGNPKPFIPRFPDIHPAFGRLVTKTFRREPLSRFPTDEAGKVDPTGFVELIQTLSTLRRTLDNVRLEIASWTTTGIVRTGNEDAYALLHACETRQDDVSEAALVLLCDGMGGYEAGEVAAALCIQILRKNLTQQPMFAHLAGASAFPADALTPPPQASGHAGPPLNVEQAKQLLKAALRDANRQVYAASRVPGSKRRGMGCTAEVVYVDGRNVVVGHVGDSRTYHLHEGRMIQLTRDQTLVNRLVELGTLTPEEAETHPRRNELQQAIGGQPDVEPGLYHGVLKPGDWVLVCSDGVTNHVSANDLKQMLQSEATSAEMAARRLVNLCNIEGATDNATIVVIRAT